MKCRFRSVLLSMLVLLLIVSQLCPAPVFAATGFERTNASNAYTIGDTVTVSMPSDGYKVAYTLNMPSSGIIKVDFSFAPTGQSYRGARFTLYNANGTDIYMVDGISRPEGFAKTEYMGLLKGTYQIFITGSASYPDTIGNATFTVSNVSPSANYQTYEDYYEGTNTIHRVDGNKKTSPDISNVSQTVHGFLAKENTEDWYRITVNGTADVTISGKYYNSDYWASAALYRENGTLDGYFCGAGNLEDNKAYTRTLSKGTYYICLSGDWLGAIYSYTITVNNGKSSVDKQTDVQTVSVGKKLNVKKLFKTKFGKKYKKFVVSPENCASVNNKGKLIAKKTGEVTVTACEKKNGSWVKTSNSMKIKIID